ncbi:putative ethylene-responsive transcription factor WRI1-like [Capsicum annuum]|uniref:elongation of fatty acids protein 3-like n=1 Tax=Capsicum annuum TaxID=4072 RepID=UPI001FB121E8|nr:elongation of fatty acids protein 3-like [Capsicum annuum]KAF3642539.1 putative ethylene-responsive transcription factor WRI1-like [Capsicum annuum]KAF3660984.1 putative ethylene-responsive transcription factor WRI1-like [Capsicum annuum]
METTLLSTINYYLVNHPTITHFQWNQNSTFGSSPLFLTLTVLAYLTLTFTFHHFPLLPTLSPTSLRFISAVHNLFLFLLSLIMAVGCSLSALHQMPKNDFTWIVCFPVDQTPQHGPVFFWAYVFYFSKILEFLDTLLIILSGSRSRRLSFLHVYHHAAVVVMCYIWLSDSQTLFPVALVTNASVHVLMYAYYFLCTLGFRPWWKRLVTNCQIVQFVFSFLISGLMLYYHFAGSGCSGIKGWCFNAVFNASLLALFIDFHSKNYAKKRKDVNKNKLS